MAQRGLRNAAGLFLASDDRFTRGAERDIEAMQAWPAYVFRQTALGHLFAPHRENRPTVRLPAGTMPLTDRQYAAAVSALRGPLTVIQGPPGTGKSEVILSLLTSIVLSGGSVLLASKNHQALDEVEKRLAPLVDEAPILTRGRDRDGERDTSFLSQMRALADGDTLHDADTASDGSPAVLVLADTFHALNTAAASRNALHVELSEAAEELNRWKEALPNPTPVRSGRWAALLSRIIRLLAGRKQPGANALMRLGKLVERLQLELAALPAPLDSETWDAQADALAADARSAMRSQARRRTTPPSVPMTMRQSTR